MATVSLQIPDPAVPRVLDAFAVAYSYQATIEGSPNPETRNQFFRRQLMEFVRNTVQAVEVESRVQAERQAALNAPGVQVT